MLQKISICKTLYNTIRYNRYLYAKETPQITKKIIPNILSKRLARKLKISREEAMQAIGLQTYNL